MKRVGLIGHSIAHSLSPVIQNAAFAHFRREERYELWDTPSTELEGRVRALRGNTFLGANVTVPYKEAVLPYLDRLDGLAEQAAAVNTIVNEGGQLAGYNTDITGFAQTLRAVDFSPKGQHSVILGSGGVARAVGLALVWEEVTSIDVCDIELERALALVDHLKSVAPGGPEIHAHAPSDAGFRAAVAACRLLVNCTPVGTRHSSLEGRVPLDIDLIAADTMVFDAVYNPAVTPLMTAAQRRGAKAIGGLWMLVYQAAASFKLWTGLEAPVDAMMAAARRALETAG
jgi:shikimate dehydrogenase